MYNVSNYMTKELMSIDCNSTIFDAIKLMRENSTGSILVKENDAFVGIFTERDLLNKLNINSTDGLESLKVSSVMTGDLKTSNYDDSYTDVIDSMQKHNIRHMPIVKDGQIVGIVSLRDLLSHYHENLNHLLKETVAALSSAVEKRDPYTAGHQQRVTQLASAIAKEMGLSERQVSGVNMAAVIHDVGKMYIPAEILNKPGKLEDAELTLIKIHPQVGFDILKGIEFPWPIAQIVLEHHERINGTGYPQGLTGDKILFEAKIICVADVVEAMASHRPYRPALGIDVALGEVIQNKGVLYDAAIVDACCKVFKEKGFKFK
ncbi:HD domain-containing phosphohydrolase [Thermoproteota archaeon]